MSIHRFIESSATKRASGSCARTSRCRSGWMLARNSTSLARERSDSFGCEALEHAELRVERLARVQVPAVLAVPEERLAAGHALDVDDVDAAARACTSSCCLAEVVADRADDADLVEERGGQREVHGGAAEHPLALAERRLDGVVGDRSDDGDWHGRAP